MELLEAASDQFCSLTRSAPGFLHFDALGFYRLADKKNGILDAVRDLLNLVKKNGGNLLVPVYSYSYAKNEIFSLKDSRSDLGRVSEYLRTGGCDLRTTDAMFSYLSYASGLREEFFSPLDYETFGDKSIIADVFNKDGYLLSVGDKLHYCTEIHFLEKMLEVPYRFNKDLSGQIKTLDGNIHQQIVTYYCRDLAFYERQNFTVSFERLFFDMKNEGLIENYIVSGVIEIYAVRFQKVLHYLKKKLSLDQDYLKKKRFI